MLSATPAQLAYEKYLFYWFVWVHEPKMAFKAAISLVHIFASIALPMKIIPTLDTFEAL